MWIFLLLHLKVQVAALIPYDHNNRPMNNGTVAMDGVQGTEPGGTKFM